MSPQPNACYVFIFEITHMTQAAEVALPSHGSGFERRVRMIASNEQAARQRLAQMYPGWQVREVIRQEYTPAICH